MTLERKILIGLCISLLIAVNFIVWQMIPSKSDPLLKKQLEQLEITLEAKEEENEILYEGIDSIRKTNDSLSKELLKSKNNAWKNKKKFNELRSRRPDNFLLDSLLLARKSRD